MGSGVGPVRQVAGFARLRLAARAAGAALASGSPAGGPLRLGLSRGIDRLGPFLTETPRRPQTLQSASIRRLGEQARKRAQGAEGERSHGSPVSRRPMPSGTL